MSAARGALALASGAAGASLALWLAVQAAPALPEVAPAAGVTATAAAVWALRESGRERARLRRQFAAIDAERQAQRYGTPAARTRPGWTVTSVQVVRPIDHAAPRELADAPERLALPRGKIV